MDHHSSVVMIAVAFGLFTKHLLIDFLLQTPYQYLNKGTYGHLGGLIHAFLHGAVTWGVMAYVMGPSHLLATTIIALIEAVVHYHIDWAKVNITKRHGWTCDKHEQYWKLLGLDQYLHSVTYIVIMSVVVFLP